MILWRYLGSHGLETLESGELMVSRISRFNDPFELMYRVGGTITRAKARKIVLNRQKSPEFIERLLAHAPHLRSSRRELRKFLRDSLTSGTDALLQNHERLCEQQVSDRLGLADKHMRIVCFSAEAEPSAEILMWSHYAAKHAGVRIGFEFPHLSMGGVKITEMKYSSQRVEVDFTNDAFGEAVQQALFESTIIKAKAWSYEREYRLFVHPDLCRRRMIDGQPREFLPFAKDWIRFVDFGVNCSSEYVSKVVKLVSAAYPKAACRRAIHHKTDFALDYPNITTGSASEPSEN